MVTDGFGDVELSVRPLSLSRPSAGRAANGGTEPAGAAGSIRSKRAEVNISLFAPESSARNTFSGQPDIFPQAHRRSEQRLRSTYAGKKLCGSAGRRRGVGRLDSIQSIASHQFRKHRPHRVRVVHQVQSHRFRAECKHNAGLVFGLGKSTLVGIEWDGLGIVHRIHRLRRRSGGYRCPNFPGETKSISRRWDWQSD